MTKELFRPEVAEARRERWLGTVQLAPPKAGWAFLLFGLTACSALGLLVFLGKYARHESVSGTLVPSKGLLAISARVPGMVVRSMVREGDAVKKGQPLIEISGERITSLGGINSTVNQQLLVQRHKLESDLLASSRMHQLQRRDLASQIAMLSRQIEELSGQIKLQGDRAVNSMAMYQQWSKVESSGVVSKLQLLQQQDAALQHMATLKELKGQYFNLKQQQRTLQSQLLQLPLLGKTKLNDIERAISGVTQAIVENEANRATILRAPSSGIVSNLLVHEGQTVDTQDRLLVILPSKSKLMAELWVSSKAIGFIKKGGRAVLRYQAFPYQKYGQQAGRVLEVSPSSISASELSKQLGIQVAEASYRVTVDLPSQYISAHGRNESLKPGMRLDADLLLDERSLIEWVIRPFVAVAKSGAKQPMPIVALG